MDANDEILEPNSGNSIEQGQMEPGDSLTSDSQVPEVPVVIEQIQDSENITYKITDANPNEATIIEIPPVLNGRKSDDCVVGENGDQMTISKVNDMKDDITSEQNEDIQNGQKEVDSNANGTEPDKMADNEVGADAPSTIPVNKSVDSVSDTPVKVKRGRHKAGSKPLDQAIQTPQNQNSDENLQSEVEKTPERRSTRSRYGRIQKTKTPDPEMVSLSTRKRRSSVKSNDNIEENKDDTTDLLAKSAVVKQENNDSKENKVKKSRKSENSTRKSENSNRKSENSSSNIESEKKRKVKSENSTELKMDENQFQSANFEKYKDKKTKQNKSYQRKRIELTGNSLTRILSWSDLTTIPEQQGDYKVGDLIWAKLPGYPFWPCMVSIEPTTGIYSKISGTSYKADRVYHVQYFGHNPFRGWTNLGMIMPFEGKEKYFDKVKKLITDSPKSQASKINAKFAIKAQKKEWEFAVDEAEEAMKLDVQTRIQNYTFEYVLATNLKRKSESFLAQSKKAKSSSSPEDVYEFDAEDMDFNDSPGAPMLLFRKRQSSKGDFSAFCKANKQKFETEYPKLSENEMMELMKKKWDLLSDDLRAQYVERSFEPHHHDLATPPKDKLKIIGSAVKKSKSQPKKKKSSPKENIPQISEGDSDSEADRLVIAETPIQKKSSKRTKKSTTNVNAKSEETENIKENNVSTSEKITSEKITSEKITPEKITPEKTNSKKKPRKSNASTEKKKSGKKQVKEVIDAPSKENITVMNPDQSTLPLGIDYFEDFTSSEDTSSISENEIGESDKPSPTETFCAICHEEDSQPLTPCQGVCLQMFHQKCIKKTDDTPFSCVDCQTGKHHCFVCKKILEEEPTIKCSDKKCGKFYHTKCLGKSHPVKFNNESKDDFICPLHFCLKCHIESEGQRNSKTKRKLVKCIYCPTAYHLGDYCIAAGTVTVTQNYVICPEHFESSNKKKDNKHINVNWCFSCLTGGKLICCEACPAAFHQECLDQTLDPESSFYCVDCTLRKQLHYDDIVWVKLGFYRWWPGRVSHPKTVPDNILKLSHGIGEFPVYFFGSHDYYWVHKGRCFLFAEGDNKAPANCGGGSKSSKALMNSFKLAMEEAVAHFEERQKFKAYKKSQMYLNKPPPYIHIRSNRPIENGKSQSTKSEQHQGSVCDCNPQSENPCGTDACLNRSLMTECDPSTCKAGERCLNQRFKKREYVKTKPFNTETDGGWGLKTLEDIKKDQFVIEYVGELIDEKECERRLKEMEEKNESNFYFLTINKDNIIDAGPKGNLARFMNHSCQPNCETQKWVVNGATRVGLFALQDIPAGTELTFNYNLVCRGNEKTKCICGSSNCSGYIGVRPTKTDDSVSKNNNGTAKKKDKKKRDSKQNLDKIRDNLIKS